MRDLARVTITDNSKFISRETKLRLHQALDEIGQRWQRHAADNAPYDTGVLRASMGHEIDDMVLTVGSTAEYAPYVELGTGPHYVRPPKWMVNLALRGHHTQDPWWYLDERENAWMLGWFVTSRPFLKPALQDNVKEYKGVVQDYLSRK